MKSFEFERKTNIGDINSSRSDNEEESAEAVVWRFFAAVSVENMFLEISQNSQENTCARVSFAGLRPAILLKKTLAQAQYILQNFEVHGHFSVSM